MPSVHKPNKNTLDIRLTESVVFLRAGDATGRQRTVAADAAPGMVRGLLILTLVKPIKVSRIEVTLIGKTVTTWPEGEYFILYQRNEWEFIGLLIAK